MAWKVFLLAPEGLRYPHYDDEGVPYGPQRTALRGIWLDAVKRPARTFRGEQYTSGFHVFAERNDANRWEARGAGAVAVPVVVRNVRIQGLHSPEGRGNEIAPELKVFVAGQDARPMILKAPFPWLAGRAELQPSSGNG